MSDVKRILEIMRYEIGKPINEQKMIIVESYLRTFTDEMVDLLLNISNKSNIVIDDLITSGSELHSLKAFQDLKDKLNSWSETQGKTFYEQIQILKSKIDNSGDAPLVIGSVRLTDNEAKVWDELLNNAWNGIIKHVDDITESYTRLGWWSRLNNQAEKAFRLINDIDVLDIKALTRDELNDLNVKVDDLIKFFKSYNVTYPYGKFKSDMIDGLTKAKNLLKPTDNFVKKGFKEFAKNFWESIAIKRVGSPEVDDFISNLIRYWDQWTKSVETKISEMQKLQKELIELSEKGEYSESKMIRYQELLFSVREGYNTSVRFYLDSNETKAYLEPEMRKMLEDSERFLRWVEAADSYKRPIPALSASADEIHAWIKTLNILIAPNLIYTLVGKLQNKNKGISYLKLFWENWKEGLMRTASAALTTSPRLPSEIMGLKNRLGPGPWALAGSLVVHNALSNMIVPYYVAFFEVSFHIMVEYLETGLQIFGDVNLHTWGEKDDPEAINFIGEGGEWKEMDYVIYQLNKRAYGSDFAESFKNFGVEDVLGSSDKSAFESIFLRWSYVDELFRKIVNFGTGGGSNQQVREQGQHLREEAAEGLENIRDTLNGLGNNIQQQTDTLANQVRDEIEDVITPDEGDAENGPVVIGPNDGRGDVIENYNNTNPNDKVTNYNRNTGEATYKGKKGKITRGGNGDLVFMSDDFQTVKNFGQ